MLFRSASPNPLVQIGDEWLALDEAEFVQLRRHLDDGPPKMGPGELIAAFLWAQLGEAEAITARRLDIWNHYHQSFQTLEESGRIRRPIIPPGCTHNAHLYYLLLNDLEDRTSFIEGMRDQGISCSFHYVPLHSASHAQQIGQPVFTDLPRTTSISNQLVRIPLWLGVDQRTVSDAAVNQLSPTLAALPSAQYELAS